MIWRLKVSTLTVARQALDRCSRHKQDAELAAAEMTALLGAQQSLQLACDRSAADVQARNTTDTWGPSGAAQQLAERRGGCLRHCFRLLLCSKHALGCATDHEDGVRIQCSSLNSQAAREEFRERDASHDAAMSAVRQESDDLRHELAQQRQQARLLLETPTAPYQHDCATTDGSP